MFNRNSVLSMFEKVKKKKKDIKRKNTHSKAKPLVKKKKRKDTTNTSQIYKNNMTHLHYAQQSKKNEEILYYGCLRFLSSANERWMAQAVPQSDEQRLWYTSS